MYVIIKLLDSGKNEVGIPTGAVIAINGIEQDVTADYSRGVVLTGITNASLSESIEISVDMSDVLYQNALTDGTYFLDVSFMLGNDEVNETLISFDIIDYTGKTYGITTSIQNDEGIDEDKLQLIKSGESAEKTITVNCENDCITNPYVTVSILEKTGSFTYEKFDNTKISVSSQTLTDLTSSQNVTVTFDSDLDVGTYKILFELYDNHGHKLSESIENFIVYE